jgi:type II secretory pathway predicted ATPase ExeA/cell division septation protein DedD
MAWPEEINQGVANRPSVAARFPVLNGQERRSDDCVGALEVGWQDPGSLTYEPTAGLREKPFSLSSDPRFFFKHSSNAAAFDALLAGIRRREGILALTGEVGTGKTTLCRAVLQALDRKTFVAFVPDPFVSREELLKTLLVDFGIVSVDDLRTGRLQHAGRAELSLTLCDFLKSLRPFQVFAVVVIDEAHHLPSSLLEEVRILADLEDRQKLLQLVLVGQPELRSRLGTFDMRQVAQRISVRCDLSPLGHKDVGPYISHRLLIAGNNVTVQFSDSAVSLVSTTSSGIPRLINIICDRALGRAVQAGSTRVETEHVLEAADEIGLHVAPVFRSHPTIASPTPAAQSQSTSAGQADDGAGRIARAGKPKTQAAPASDTGRRDHGLEATLHLRDGEKRLRLEEDSGDFDEYYPVARPRRRRVFALVAVVMLAALGAIGYRYWVSAGEPPVSELIANPAVLFESPTPRVASTTDTPVAMSRAVTLSPSPPAPKTEPARFVLEMGMFESADTAAQALNELRDAGFRSYSIEVSTSDGERAHAVFVGPYSEFGAVQRDFERAKQIPGYDGAHIVPIGPTALPTPESIEGAP